LSPRSLGSSAFLHAVIILLAVFGLPSLFMTDEPLYQPQVISVELLPIAPINNAPNRTPKPPKKEPVKPPVIAKKEPVKKPTPPKPEPKKEEPTPAPKPEPVKKEETKKEEKKPDPEEKPKKEEKKEEEKSFEDLMKELDEKTPEPDKAEEGEPIKSDTVPDPTAPLSQTVENSIRSQIMKCWNYPSGAKGQETLVAHIQVSFREDGSVADSKLRASDQFRYNSEREFKALVDSANRAIRNTKCVPLKNLPINEYNSWSKVELVFDPDEMW
jgi:colicin import membrane protein